MNKNRRGNNGRTENHISTRTFIAVSDKVKQ